MNNTTTTVSAPAPTTSAPAAGTVSKIDAAKVLGIELGKGENLVASMFVVETDNGLELRSPLFGENAVAIYRDGQIVSNPGPTWVAELNLKTDKSGNILRPEIDVNAVNTSVLRRLGFSVLQLLSITPKSPFTPKGSKSDKAKDRMAAQRELSKAGLRS
jgi:hypothetical protein